MSIHVVHLPSVRKRRGGWGRSIDDDSRRLRTQVPAIVERLEPRLLLAIGTPSSIGTAANTTSSTTLAISVTVAVPVGNTVILTVDCDPGTSPNAITTASVVDNATGGSNTYT